MTATRPLSPRSLDPEAHRRLRRAIAEHAPQTAASTVPDLRAHIAPDVFALWAAAEAALGRTIDAPFWATAWPGGQALARHLLDGPPLDGVRVAALAAGAGLEAIAAAKSGAERVIWNDVDPLAVVAFEMNAEANGARADSRVGDGATLLDGLAPGRDADVALIGDAFYEGAGAARLIAAARRFVARGGRVLAADPDRGRRPDTGVRRLATIDVEVSRTLEGVGVRKVDIYEFFA